MNIPSVPMTDGRAIPQLGLGTSGMREVSESAVSTALQIGYRHIDTAKLYANEAAVGSAVKKSGIPRDEIFVTTKLWPSDHKYEDALAAIDLSLSNLGMDHVDLYLIHWPDDIDKGMREETWHAMEEIHRQGKALSIGVSNYSVAQLQEMERYAKVPVAMNQIQRHPFYQQSDVVDYCRANGIAVTNYSPVTRNKRSNDPVIEDLAKKYGKSRAQILLRWGVQQGNIVIPKASREDHMRENMQIFDFSLADEDMNSLNSLDEGYSVI